MQGGPRASSERAVAGQCSAWFLLNRHEGCSRTEAPTHPDGLTAAAAEAAASKEASSMRLVALALAAAPVAAQDSDLHNQAKDIGSKAVDAIGGLISGAGSAIGKGISSGIDHLKGQFTPPPSPAPLSPPTRTQ